MAYTSKELQEQKNYIAALKSARTKALATGGVYDFEQLGTHLKKATLQEIKDLLNEAENTLFRMEDVS